MRQFGEEFEEDFFDAVSIQATLDCHDVIGGTARARVHAALAETQQRVDALAAKYGARSPREAEAAHAGA